MSKIVTAVCEKQVFDNEQGLLCFPGNEYEIDLESDAAMSFKLSPTDRDYAIKSRAARIAIREAEKKRAADRNFASVYEMRKYDQEFGEPTPEVAAANSNDGGIPEPEPVKEKPKFLCPKCGKDCHTKQGVRWHLQKAKEHNPKPIVEPETSELLASSDTQLSTG